MCGICGIVRATTARSDRNSGFDADIDKNIVSQMTEELSHRGPDGSGISNLDSITFGHRRLSIIDVGGGAQPMSLRDKSLLITFNGEIFNYLELRDELIKNGQSFSTSSDTEVLLVGYRTWGEDLFSKLNGQFAFALYDSNKKETLLVRDRMGEKPLYFSRLNSDVAFASEVKSIVAFHAVSGSRLDFHYQNFVDFFSFNYVPQGGSFFRNVESIPPGTFMRIRGKEISNHRYWNPHSVVKDPVERRFLPRGT